MPEVFLGADAAGAFGGERGLLYGAKRHRQVDVLGFESLPEAAADAGSGGLERLAEGRFRRDTAGGWRAVGVAVGRSDLPAGSGLLLDLLVAGDVVIAGPAGEEDPAPVLVHRGDRLVPTRVV